MTGCFVLLWGSIAAAVITWPITGALVVFVLATWPMLARRKKGA